MGLLSGLRSPGQRNKPLLPKGGYSGYTSLSFATITTFNIVMSCMMLAVTIPIILITAASIKLRDGGPILYKGERYGKNKRPFIIYKFRTLPKDAQKIIGADMLEPRHKMVTPTTRFLRDTRIDELPQLINVLRGDMDFIGPRPIRPEVYHEHCQDIPNFDRRFIVRPGLIGYSQIFTPHSSPKRIRSLIDNKFIELKRSLLWDLAFIFYVIFILAKKIITKGSGLLWTNILKLYFLQRHSDRRYLERIKSANTGIEIHDHETDAVISSDLELIDINYYYFKIHSRIPLQEATTYCFALHKVYSKRKQKKRKRAFCEGSVFKVIQEEPGHNVYVVHYEPVSDFNRYLFDQYFLKQSIAEI